MSQERTEGVVLRGVDFSETSRIVTFLSPDRGRLTCLAKGAKRPKSPLRAVLDTFNRVEMVYYWKDSRQVQQLGDVTLLDGYSGVKADLAKTTFASFPLEMALKIAHENEPSQALYATLVRGLANLDAWRGDARTHGCWQAVQILSAAGFEVAVDRCAQCGAAVAGPGGFAYHGGAVCARCRSDVTLPRAQWDALCAMVRARERCPETAAEAALFDLVWRYASAQLETDFRSVRVIREMFG